MERVVTIAAVCLSLVLVALVVVLAWYSITAANENAECSKHKTVLQESVIKQKGDLRELAKKAFDLKIENDELKQVNSSLNDVVSQLRSEIIELKREKEELQERLSGEIERNENLEAALRALEVQETRLRAQLETQARAQAILQEQVARKEKERRETDERYSQEKERFIESRAKVIGETESAEDVAAFRRKMLQVSDRIMNLSGEKNRKLRKGLGDVSDSLATLITVDLCVDSQEAEIIDACQTLETSYFEIQETVVLIGSRSFDSEAAVCAIARKIRSAATSQ